MEQKLRETLEDIIKNKMGGICEGALWIEHNRYGTHIGHFNAPYETINALKKEQYTTTTIESETTVNIYLVPKGEGYKNFNNIYASYDDWMNLVISYEWILAYTIVLNPSVTSKNPSQGNETEFVGTRVSVDPLA